MMALLTLLLFSCAVAALGDYAYVPSVWPEPQAFTTGPQRTPVSPFRYVLPNGHVQTLTDAFLRTNQLIFTHQSAEAVGGVFGAVYTVRVEVADNSEAYPQLTTDESYTLGVPALLTKTAAAAAGTDSAAADATALPSHEILLTAKTVYGALMGLQSLSQLVVFDFDSESYLVPGTPIQINDAPRYPHRGMLLDTARHFQPIAELRDTIDALSWAKYNVLHWHVVDTQSFPFQSVSSERLWKGAFSNSERYSRSDVASLVEFGRARGVKVMIEFDVPGHAASWCAGYPDICPSPTCLQPLDPSSNNTFPLIEGLLGECTGAVGGVGEGARGMEAGREEGKGEKGGWKGRKAEMGAEKVAMAHVAAGSTASRLTFSPAATSDSALFPYSLLHLGGDEVSYTCWEQSAHIQQWEADNGLQGSEDTYEYFVDKVASMARQQGRTPVQWVEVFEHFGASLDQNTVVHVWKEKSTLDGVLAAGYNALLSNEDMWYLDHLATTWDVMYANEPTDGLAPTSDPSLILGGESCMWGETVDASDLMNTVWPRAAAVAEVLWSPYEKVHSLPGNAIDFASAEARLETFRCLLTQRGIGAAPVTNTQARYQPLAPGSCFAQRRM